MLGDPALAPMLGDPALAPMLGNPALAALTLGDPALAPMLGNPASAALMLGNPASVAHDQRYRCNVLAKQTRRKCIPNRTATRSVYPTSRLLGPVTKSGNCTVWLFLVLNSGRSRIVGCCSLLFALDRSRVGPAVHSHPPLFLPCILVIVFCCRVFLACCCKLLLLRGAPIAALACFLAVAIELRAFRPYS